MASNRGKGMAVTVALVLLVGIGAMAYSGIFGDLFRKSPAEIAKAAGVAEDADTVKIPLRSLESGKALFLASEAGGRRIHYFVLKSSDGQYRAALDACDVCFRANKGYRQESDRMVCNQCGQAFPSVKVNEVRGGCNPVPLERKVEGEHLVIRKGDIVAGETFFPGGRT